MIDNVGIHIQEEYWIGNWRAGKFPWENLEENQRGPDGGEGKMNWIQKEGVGAYSLFDLQVWVVVSKSDNSTQRPHLPPIFKQTTHTIPQ